MGTQQTKAHRHSLRAIQQYEALREALLQVGYKPERQVHTHVITLGATGTIYTDTHSTLRHLGIDGKTASQRCCADLHIRMISTMS